MKLEAISIITADMPAAITFYSALGLELADGGPDAPHTEFTAGSLRILLDTEAVMLGIDPEWTRPTGAHTMSLAFDCSTAEAVDAAYPTSAAASPMFGTPAWRPPMTAPRGVTRSASSPAEVVSSCGSTPQSKRGPTVGATEPWNIRAVESERAMTIRPSRTMRSMHTSATMSEGAGECAASGSKARFPRSGSAASARESALSGTETHRLARMRGIRVSRYMNSAC
ncbi:VOC family protein [Brevibacterium linens]|uniref:VOC family protein n=1 Tax=Brevibacterium linens TaxID=1703 RepID=UPI003F8A971C